MVGQTFERGARTMDAKPEGRDGGQGGAPRGRDDRRDDRRGGGGGTFRSRGFFKKPRVCPLSGTDAVIDHKDIKLLGRFLTECGKIIPRRVSGVSAKNQRRLAQAVKRARFLALLPYVID